MEEDLSASPALLERNKFQGRQKNRRYKRPRDVVAQERTRQFARWAWFNDTALLWTPSTAIH